MYDLAGADESRRFSPHCWRIKLALHHKGLDYETIPWRFTEKDAISMSGQGKVPVIVDGDRVLSDSWAIAIYLDEHYPEKPSLLGDEAARASAAFIRAWSEQVVAGLLARCIMVDVYAHLHEDDKQYFRSTREARFGQTLEAYCADRESVRERLQSELAPLRRTLGEQPFLGGQRPMFTDYMVFGYFQWARCVSPFVLLQADDPVADWRGRMLGLYAGVAGNATGYEP
jgi:glutathione S-transferase